MNDFNEKKASLLKVFENRPITVTFDLGPNALPR